MHDAGKGSLATINTVAADCPKQLGNQRGLADGEQEAQTVHHQVLSPLSGENSLVIGNSSEKQPTDTCSHLGSCRWHKRNPETAG